MGQIENDRTYFNRFPFLCSLSCVSVVFGLILLTVTPIFETVDDTCMKAIVSGVLIAPAPSSMTAFSNVILGWGLQTLYEAYPGIPWYPIYQLTVHFLAHVTLLWAFLLIVPNRRTVTLFGLYLFTVGLHLVVHLSFTTTAYLAIQSGAALVIVQLILNQGTRLAGFCRFGAGTFLILAGCLIRFQMFKLLVLLAIPFTISVCLSHGSRRLYLQAVILSCVIGGPALGLAWFDHHVLAQTPGWATFPELIIEIYRTSDLARINILETQPSAAHDVLRSVEWSTNDFYVMKSWFLIDDTTYSLDHLRLFADQWLQLDASGRQHLIRLIAAIFLITRTHLCISCLFLGGISSPSKDNRSALWGHRFGWGLNLGIMAVLAWSQKLPERVFLPMLAFTAMLSLLLCLLSAAAPVIQPASRFSLVRYRVGIMVVVAFCLASIVGDVVWQARVKRQHDLLAADMKWVASHENSLFLMMFPFPYECLLPWDDLHEYREAHSVMTGLYLRTPHTTKLLNSYGVTDLLTTLATQPGCRIAADKSRIKYLEQYLKEHRPVSVQFKAVYQAKSGFTVYASVPRSK